MLYFSAHNLQSLIIYFALIGISILGLIPADLSKPPSNTGIYLILIENQIANYEIQRNNPVYIETYCMEFEAFESQLKKKKELNSIGFEA